MENDIHFKDVKKGWIELIKKFNEQTNSDILNYPCEKKVFPKKENIFEAFKYFEPQDTKMVIWGQDPYHGENQATGLCFQCKDKKIQPSLRNIQKIYKGEIDFEEWAKRGVLLLNTSLTVYEKEPNSHSKYWRSFTEFIFRFLNEQQNVYFVCWGKHAIDLCKDADKDKIIACSHPSPFSFSRQTKNMISFEKSDIFNLIKQKTNVIL